MAQISSPDSTFTTSVKSLLNLIESKSQMGDSLFEIAHDFFANLEDNNKTLESLNERILTLQTQAKDQTDKKVLTRINEHIETAVEKRSAFEQQLEDSRIARHKAFSKVSQEALELIESYHYQDVIRNSAKILSNIQLQIPTDQDKAKEFNLRYRHLYRTVLVVRLFDEMYAAGEIEHPYLGKHLGEPEEFDPTVITPKHPQHKTLTQNVRKPLIMASLLLHIGYAHPDAIKLAYGEENDLNPFRDFTSNERRQLITICYKAAMSFYLVGIGKDKYIGNSRDERDLFIENENQKQDFIHFIIKDWIKPKTGLGNMMKVADLYTGIVLSIKPSYDYRLIPKVNAVIEQNVEKGICSEISAKLLRKITGDFPLGYGITYIPQDEMGNDLERYEYAIVTGLYPMKPDIPFCRQATRNLAFISHGIDFQIAPSNNLYYKECSKKIAKISKERLQEILAVLSSNYRERKDLDLIPRVWHPREYFSDKKHQNLWNRKGPIDA